MNPLTALDRHFHSLELLQLLLLFVFVIAYVTTIGRVWSARGQLRAAGAAVLAAIGLCLTVDPWTVGALMVVAAVAAVGLFVLATMLIGRALCEVDAAARAQRLHAVAPQPGPVPATHRLRGAGRATAIAG